MHPNDLKEFRERVADPRMQQLFNNTNIPDGACYIDALSISSLDGRNCGVDSRIEASGLVFQEGKAERYFYDELDVTSAEFFDQHKDAVFLSDGTLHIVDELIEMEVHTRLRNIQDCSHFFGWLSCPGDIHMEMTSIPYEKLKQMLKEQESGPSTKPITFSSLIPGQIGKDLDRHFKENGWELQLWTTKEGEGYQVYFGKGVQVDNLYEYGFPHLYEEEDLIAFAQDFYDNHIASEKNTLHKETDDLGLNHYDDAIQHLCEVLNNHDYEMDFDDVFEPLESDDFIPLFKSKNYFGIYCWHNEGNEYYLLDRNSGEHKLVLGDSFEFVGKNMLDCLKNEEILHVANTEFAQYLYDFSYENVKGLFPIEDLQGLAVLQSAIRAEKVKCDGYFPKPSLADQILSASSRSDASPLSYDNALAQRLKGVDGVDVLTPQETADLFGKPVKDSSGVYYPVQPDAGSKNGPKAPER